jgi:hypothetical protein
MRALAEACRVYVARRGLGEAAAAAEATARAIYDHYGWLWNGLWWSARSSLHAWEAHHVVPVVEGGGECGLEGLVTLCLPCHRRETAALAAQRAQRRQRNRVLPAP